MSRLTFELGNELSKDLDFSISFHNMNYEHCSPRKKEVNKQSQDYCLHFVLYGKGKITLSDGTSYFVNSGSAFLLYKDETYSYAPLRNDPWSYFWFSFDGDNIEEFVAAAGFSKQHPFVVYDNPAVLNEVLKGLINDYGKTNAEIFTCSSYFMRLMSLFIDANKGREQIQKYSPRFKRTRELLIYTACNYRLPLTVEEVAANCNISSSYLMSIFSEEVGMSFVSYLNKLKISHACELISEGEMSIEQIANYVGFDDAKYFSRVFKKVMDMTPSEYKKSQPNDDPFLWVKEKGFEEYL